MDISFGDLCHDVPKRSPHHAFAIGLIIGEEMLIDIERDRGVLDLFNLVPDP